MKRFLPALITAPIAAKEFRGSSRFLDEREWELQSVRATVQELESQGSRTSFESVVSKDPQTPPGLLAPTLHSHPMSVADPSHEWYAAVCDFCSRSV